MNKGINDQRKCDHCKEQAKKVYVYIYMYIYIYLGFPRGSAVTESTCSAEDAADSDSDLITGLGRSPGGGMATHSSNLAWRIPWTEEPGSP